MLRRSLLFSSRPRGVRLLRGALAAAALAAPLAAAAPGDAVALTVQPRGATVTVSGSSHGNVVWPGDSFSVKTSVENGDPAQPTLTGARGDLSSPASGLSLTQASSTFPDLQFGTPTANDTAFAGTLAAAAECGADVPLSLALSANQGSAQLPYSIPTGSVGPKQSYDSTAGTQAIPDNGTLTSVLHVGNTGRVKHLSVRIGNIQHTYDADLRIELVAPDGTSATLVNGQGGSDPNGAKREGAASPTVTASQTNRPPLPPTNLLASNNGSSTTLIWTASPGDPDAGDHIAFYRIYRDGVAYANRYDRTGLGTDTSYVDTRTGGMPHSYSITAVDTQLAESPLLGPVTR